MNFKDFFLTSSQFPRIIFISTGHTFKAWCTPTLKNLDTAIRGSSKDILGLKYAYL